MDLRRLEHFRALCEHGSFSRAAESVCLSQSALSRSIQSLESDLGVTLFDRLPHGVSLTPAGRMLAPGAQRLLGNAKELLRHVEQFRLGDVSEIRLGMSPTPGALLLKPLLAKVMSARPSLRMNTRTARNPDLIEGLRAEKFDLVVLDATYLDDPQDFAVHALAPQNGGLWARSGHPLLGQGEVPVDALECYPVLGVNFSTAFSRRLVHALGPAAELTRLVTVLCDSYSVQRELVLESDAVMLACDAIVLRDVETGQIAPLPLRTAAPMPKALHAMVRLAERESSPALAFVQETIQKLYQNTSSISIADRSKFAHHTRQD